MNISYYRLIYLLFTAVGLCLGQPKLIITPQSGSSYKLHDIIAIKCSLDNTMLQDVNSEDDTDFYLGIRYNKHKIASRNIAMLHFNESSSYSLNDTLYFKLTISNKTGLAADFVFTAEMIQIGYGGMDISLAVLEADSSTQVWTNEVYSMASVREMRLVDTGFNMAITILASLNTFALGCVTDIDSIRNAAKHRMNILLALLTQYTALPTITFGLLKVLAVQNEMALGFLFLTCVPGGGLGYLTVSVTGNTDKEYSVLLNVLQLTVPIVAVPMYVYSLGQLFPNGAGQVVTSLYYLVIWLLVLPLPFAIGMLIRRRKQDLSEAFLNWLIKPFLLLAFILFITLGLYINMYVFRVLDTAALVAGGFIPFLGFGIGGGLALVARQGKNSAKTLAIESTIMNSIAAMVALRFTLPQPDADLTSAAAMWVLFLTPVPFVLMFIFHRIKRKIMLHFNKKSLQDERKTTIMTSFAAITHNAMQMGGIDRQEVEHELPSPLLNYPGAESHMLITDSDSYNDHPHAITNNVSFSLTTPVKETNAEISETVTG